MKSWMKSILVLTLFLLCVFPVHHVLAQSGTNPQGKIADYLQEKGGKDELLDVEDLKVKSKTSVSGLQIIGIDFTVFFFIMGWIIIVLAAGLKHPEYQKWGRGSIYTSILGYIAIKFGPIIFYNL